jgi:O2-independent ubiquinone biosynthesis accessory factor UbiT
MTPQISHPPFSPALVAGMLFPPIARPVVSAISQAFATKLWKDHRQSFDRLKPYEGATFLIDPIDLPIVFHLELAPLGPKLKTVEKQATLQSVDATIRGSIKGLIDMVEGRVDGDALFFSRELEFGGDTEAVVALRNAIDDADINIVEEITASFGPLRRPAKNAAKVSTSIASRIIVDFETLQSSLLGPSIRRLETEESRVEDLELQVRDLEKKVAKQSARMRAMENREKKANANKA